MFVDVLPRWERYTYWICGLSSLAYCVFSIYLEGESYKKSYINNGLTPGWNWIGRPKDNTHFGWHIWMNTVLIALPWNLIHIMISQTCRHFQVNGRIRCLLLTTTSLCLLGWVYGVRNVTLLLVVATVMYLNSREGRLCLIWFVAVVVTFSMDCGFVDKYKAHFLQIGDRQLYFQFHISLSLIWLKIISFSVEKNKYTEHQASTKKVEDKIPGHIDALSDTNSNNPAQFTNPDNEIKVHMDIVESDPSFLDFLFYLFYYPTFFWGPFYDYCHFHNQVKASFKSSIIKENIYDIIKQLIKIGFFMFLIEIHTHFLYYSRMGLDSNFVEDMSDWAFYGIIYCHSCAYQTKYFVGYGFGIHMSRLDGIAPVSITRCIHFSYSAAGLWKSFDEGIYIFLKKCIFVPLGGSRRGVLRQISVSGFCFLFMILWHGASMNILIWGVGNYFTSVLELAGHKLVKSDIGVKMKSYLSPAMTLRLKALLHYPLYMMILLTGYYFFYGMHVGWIAFSKMTFQASWLDHATRCFLLTSSLHTAIYLEELYKHRTKQHAENHRTKQHAENHRTKQHAENRRTKQHAENHRTKQHAE